MDRDRRIAPVGLGFRARKGGSVIVAVSLEAGEPRVLLSSFLATADEGDRVSLEPFHIAAETERGPDGASAQARAAVAEGRERQDALAASGLERIVTQLRAQGNEPSIAALLVNRAGWIRDLLSYSLAFANHPPVAEGLAVRDALRFALSRVRLAVRELDEKSLPELASERLGLDSNALDARLKSLGAAAGKPWRKEQKLACLAAWTALTAGS